MKPVANEFVRFVSWANCQTRGPARGIRAFVWDQCSFAGAALVAQPRRAVPARRSTAGRGAAWR
eukprot:10018541-Lingulodinium_polyedra.AAC.1